MSKIIDSGERREFATGAVRDVADGKGRCDLLPLDVVAELMFSSKHNAYFDSVIQRVSEFSETGNKNFLILSLYAFMDVKGWDVSTMLLEVSKHFEDGAKKYGEYNWQKGIPLHCYIDSGVRHYLKWCRGDKDEPHDKAFVWNILCALWTLKNKPELDDMRHESNEGEDDET